MVNNNNKDYESKAFAVQKFYTKKQALSIEISQAGIFFEVAPALAESDRYNWEAKTGVKFSISEVCNMLYALEVLRTRGEQAYNSLCQAVLGEGLKNMQFVHLNTTPRKNQGYKMERERQALTAKQTRTGLNYYKNTVSFVINRSFVEPGSADLKIYFPILPVDKIRLEKFLNYIVSIAFNKGV